MMIKYRHNDVQKTLSENVMSYINQTEWELHSTLSVLGGHQMRGVFCIPEPHYNHSLTVIITFTLWLFFIYKK